MLTLSEPTQAILNAQPVQNPDRAQKSKQNAIQAVIQALHAVDRIELIHPPRSTQPTFSEFMDMVNACTADPSQFILQPDHEGFVKNSTISDFLNAENRISFLRSFSNLTQVDFAKKYGVAHRTVTNWEQGLAKPSESHLYLLAYAVFCG